MYKLYCQSPTAQRGDVVLFPLFLMKTRCAVLEVVEEHAVEEGGVGLA